MLLKKANSKFENDSTKNSFDKSAGFDILYGMKKFTLNLIKSIMGGLMIVFGATAYLMSFNKIVGSILFAVGLLVISIYDFNLYTGKAGYVFANKNPIQLLTILLGNFVGALAGGSLIRLTRLDIIQTAVDISTTKLNDNLLSIFILSVFCGILMFLAVDIYKNAKDSVVKYMGIFICIPVFILSGFEHSIANMVYFIIANIWSAKALLYIFIMLIGNFIGAVLIYFAANTKNKLTKSQ